MNIGVAFLPSLLREPERYVCVVVDVLRASSSLVVLFERGVEEVLPAAGIPEARRLARQRPHYILCGERGGLPPRGFQYGNSPAEFAQLDMAGRGVILCTTNGTKALARVKAAPLVLVGALLNASAAATAAVEAAAEQRLDVAIVCSGEEGGTAVALEDVGRRRHCGCRPRSRTRRAVPAGACWGASGAIRRGPGGAGHLSRRSGQ
jgi:2-phosphosulfolactate phosphatase